MTLTAREHIAGATTTATHEIVLNLERARSSLESLVHDMKDLTCLITTEGRVIWGNTTTASWLDIDHDALHLAQMRKLFDTEQWADFSEKLSVFNGAEPAKRVLEFPLQIHNSKGFREIFWTVKQFQALSSRRGIILLVVGRDITEVLRERSERAKLETQLETAQLMQAAFFPAPFFRTSGLDISSFYRPAEQCSGDWWGHFTLSEGVDLLCVGDVTGHGAASALVTAMTQATCMSYANAARESGSEVYHSPTRLLNQINRVVYDTFKGKFFMTFFAVVFDTRKKTLRASNAGHNFPLFFKGDVRDQILSTKQSVDNVRTLRGPDSFAIQGNPIGFDPDTVYIEKEVAIHHNDRYVLYTDGLIECKNVHGHMFGLPNFRKAMTQNVDKDPNGCRDAIVESALNFFGEQPLADDLTLVCVDVNLNGKND